MAGYEIIRRGVSEDARARQSIIIDLSVRGSIVWKTELSDAKTVVYESCLRGNSNPQNRNKEAPAHLPASDECGNESYQFTALLIGLVCLAL